ncbi:MAG: type III pantothenate kinase [Spirosomataceae bacterium]
MLLAIDIGNTDVVFGIYQQSKPIYIWRTATVSEAPVYRYQAFLQLQMLEADIIPGQIEKIVVSSVVPELTVPMTDALEKLTGVKPIIVNADTYPALRLDIDRPYELGSDLIANAIAVYHRYRQNSIIVDFGTALTFTAVTGDGRVVGVSIVPGLKTAVRALFAHTAQLPEVPLLQPETAIGKNTTHSIQSGILIGYEGLVKYMISRFKQEMGGECVVVATGGLSSIINTLATEFTEVDRALTLDGLRIIGESS